MLLTVPRLSLPPRSLRNPLGCCIIRGAWFCIVRPSGGVYFLCRPIKKARKLRPSFIFFLVCFFSHWRSGEAPSLDNEIELRSVPFTSIGHSRRTLSSSTPILVTCYLPSVCCSILMQEAVRLCATVKRPWCVRSLSARTERAAFPQL